MPSGTDDQTWLVHFDRGAASSLDMRKLPALLAEMNVSSLSQSAHDSRPDVMTCILTCDKVPLSRRSIALISF